MKLLFLVRTMAFGGAERQLVALATGLAERGHDVRVMVFYPDGPLEDDLRSAGIPITSLDKKGRWDNIAFFWRTAVALRKERPDAVHGYLPTSNILTVLFKAVHRGKSVYGVRASDIEIESSDVAGRLETKVESVLARFADLIIANSHAGKSHAVSAGFPERKITVIPNGTDTESFRFDPVLRAATRADFGLEDNQRLIGRVGRFAPQKDYPTFLRASAIVAANRPETRFVIVGDGPETLTVELKSLAKELQIDDHVVWAGTMIDMPAVYSACDLTVSSSAFGEGTPNVVAESMSCGVPCVVTDAGDSARYTFDPTWVSPIRDPEALASVMLRVLSELDANGIERSSLRARVTKSLSRMSLISSTEAVLAELLQAPSPPANATSKIAAR